MGYVAREAKETMCFYLTITKLYSKLACVRYKVWF